MSRPLLQDQPQIAWWKTGTNALVKPLVNCTPNFAWNALHLRLTGPLVRGQIETTNEGGSVKRQGDILLVPVEKMPDGLTEVPREKGKIILAEGEITNHLHAIEAPEATFLAEDLESIEGRFLVVEAEAATAGAAGVALEHPEHDTIVLEPGVYEVRRQREYTEAGGISVVAD
jgi:hypothetical protein